MSPPCRSCGGPAQPNWSLSRSMAITIRPATAADQPAITALIKLLDLLKLNLKWPHFVVAVDDASGQLVATGQIKQHGDGTHELASIATHPTYQHRGLATQ